MNTHLRTLAAIFALGAGTVMLDAGCAGTATSKSTGEFIEDASITAKVKTAFVQDPVVHALQVGVDTFKGNVQLNGFVDTPEQKARAEQVARSVSGVGSVQNNLTVKANTR